MRNNQWSYMSFNLICVVTIVILLITLPVSTNEPSTLNPPSGGLKGLGMIRAPVASSRSIG